MACRLVRVLILVFAYEIGDIAGTVKPTTWSKTDPGDVATQPGHKDRPGEIHLDHLKIAGMILLPISVVSIIINGCILAVIFKNWEQIDSSLYLNSCILSFALTVSDFAMASLLGLPIGIRFANEKAFRDIASFTYYTENVGMFLFHYLMMLRMMLIAAISLERCFHICFPFKYMVVATKFKLFIVLALIVIIPIPKLSVAIHLSIKNGYVNCQPYEDGEMDPKSYYTPLVCLVHAHDNQYTWLNPFDEVLKWIIAAVSWLVTLISNLVSLAVAFDKSRKGFFCDGQREDMKKNLLKSCLIVVVIATIFALTNGPYTYGWTIESDATKRNKLFFVSVLSFVSLLSNPFLYSYRLRNIREYLTGFKRNVTSNLMHTLTTPRSSNPAALPIRKTPSAPFVPNAPPRSREGSLASKYV